MITWDVFETHHSKIKGETIPLRSKWFLEWVLGT